MAEVLVVRVLNFEFLLKNFVGIQLNLKKFGRLVLLLE